MSKFIVLTLACTVDSTEIITETILVQAVPVSSIIQITLKDNNLERCYISIKYPNTVHGYDVLEPFAHLIARINELQGS